MWSFGRYPCEVKQVEWRLTVCCGGYDTFRQTCERLGVILGNLQFGGVYRSKSNDVTKKSYRPRQHSPGLGWVIPSSHLHCPSFCLHVHVHFFQRGEKKKKKFTRILKVPVWTALRGALAFTVSRCHHRLFTLGQGGVRQEESDCQTRSLELWSSRMNVHEHAEKE